MPKVEISTVHFGRYVVALRKRLTEHHGWPLDRAAGAIIDNMPFLLETFKRPMNLPAADEQVDGMAQYLYDDTTRPRIR